MSDEQKGQQTRAARAKNIFDNTKLHLTTKCPTDESKLSSFRVNINRNNAQFLIYTNDPNDKNEERNNGRIEAKMSLVDLSEFFILFEEIIRDPQENKIMVETHDRDKETGKTVPVARLIFGKNSKGIIFITINQGELSKIQFNYGYNRFTKFLDNTGSPMQPSRLSELHALSWLTTMRSLAMQYAGDNFYDHSQNSGNNGGGFNRNNNGGGYNRGGGGGYNGNKGGGYQKTYGGNNGGGYNNRNSNQGGGGGYSNAGKETDDTDVDIEF